MYKLDNSDSYDVVEREWLARLVLAFMLIWVGFILMAGYRHWLADVPLPDLVWFHFLRVWLSKFDFDFRVIPLIFLGNAGILFVELLVRLAVQRMRHSISKVIFFFFIFIGLTLGSYGFINLIVVCPYIMVVAGVSIIFELIFRKHTKYS